MPIDHPRDRASAGHWVRHTTPAGTGLRWSRARRVIDAALVLMTFGALVGSAIALGVGR